MRLKGISQKGLKRISQTFSSTADYYPEGMEIAFYAVTKPPRPYDDTHA